MGEFQERRRFHRFPFEARCTVSFGERGEQPCELLDLSLNGALVRLPKQLQSAAAEDPDPVASGSLQLHLRGLRENDQTRMDMAAQIVRVQEDTLACRFVSLDESSFAALKALVAANLGDETLLKRELTQLDYWPGLSITPSD